MAKDVFDKTMYKRMGLTGKAKRVCKLFVEGLAPSQIDNELMLIPGTAKSTIISVWKKE